MIGQTWRLTVSTALVVTIMALLDIGRVFADARPLQQPMQAQAQRAASRPMKLDVRLPGDQIQAGTNVAAEVLLLDADNRQSGWNRPTQIQIEITSSTGTVQKKTVTIQPGQGTAGFTFLADQPGLTLLKATDSENILLPGGNSTLVNRAAAKPKKKSTRKSRGFLVPLGQPRLLEVGMFSSFNPDWEEQAPDNDSRNSSSNAPQLLLNKEGKDEILADGKDVARIKVFYMDPDGNPAPNDIKVWLAWSNGELTPNPLIINKGTSFGVSTWVSDSPVNATVKLVNTAPRYEVSGKREMTVSFVPAIYGVGSPSPSPLKLSLIDAAPLDAQFFDQNGRAVQTSKTRRITFVSSNPTLHLDPGTKDVQVNESGTSIYLIPTWRGTARVDIWTPGYDHQTMTVEVTVWLVIVLCVLGGVLGGIAAKTKLQGSLVQRIFVGVLGGVILVWSIVYAILPMTHSIIAHNLVSVFVVGIIGGYGGTGVLDWALKRFTSAKAQGAAG